MSTRSTRPGRRSPEQINRLGPVASPSAVYGGTAPPIYGRCSPLDDVSAVASATIAVSRVPHSTRVHPTLGQKGWPWPQNCWLDSVHSRAWHSGIGKAAGARKTKKPAKQCVPDSLFDGGRPATEARACFQLVLPILWPKRSLATLAGPTDFEMIDPWPAPDQNRPILALSRDNNPWSEACRGGPPAAIAIADRESSERALGWRRRCF